MARSDHSISRPLTWSEMDKCARLWPRPRLQKKGIVMRRLGLFIVVIAAAPAVLPLEGTSAQSYPERPIKLVVPFVPGSPVDVLGRVVSQQLGTRLGQSVVVDNRPGGGTSTATKAVAAAPAE